MDNLGIFEWMNLYRFNKFFLFLKKLQKKDNEQI